jgi:hypothetical protein
MLYIVLADGTVDEIPDATGIASNDGTLICSDLQGHEIRRYERDQVLMFGMDETVKELADKVRQGE